ncbi:MAG: PAS domain-containing protein [Deltaproteobacteria bacterium]|jgi:two-component system phosphate regulon sensor histidine kinase PhoR|nr:PAS domain-containing protein [Deltaproteobacteria bacterium]
MPRKRLIWQIYPPFLLTVLVAIGAVTWFFSQAINQFYIDQTRNDLEARARFMLPLVDGNLNPANTVPLDSLCKHLGRQTGTRLTIIDNKGVVLADSDENPSRMDNHADRPEIISALNGHIGVSTRYSHTLQQNMMYVAVPASLNGQIVGSIRAALPLAKIDQTLNIVLYQALTSGLLIVLIAALVSLWLSRRISRPLEEMKRGADRFARGELDRRLPDFASEELGGLSEAMNQMAAQLDDRIRTVVRQHNEQEAVLASMVEGVFAIDKKEKIIRVNSAARELLGLDISAIGRKVHEVLRKPDLLNFIDRAQSSHERIEEDIILNLRGEERLLQSHGTPLRDARGREIGALIVFNDITHLKRLENIRQDFVANVSHELKTPITAIKGSVETLIGGAMDDEENALRFLEIISRQADRLNAIIEDLLALSRIEQDEEQAGIELRQAKLHDFLVTTLQACQIKARDKQVKLEMDCPEDLQSNINAPLFEQALVNLIDNAIKYSPEDGLVKITARQLSGEIVLQVQDWGSGIAREHLPRLFERFYRVDKARSRKLGGTGLGLAIVKHIVQAHHGKISVESTPGEGSIFTIQIPS